LLLVQAFVNTRDIEAQSDLLADVDSARTWFVDAGLLEAQIAMSAADLELAHAVRESVRDLLTAGHRDGHHGANLGPLRGLADTHRPRLTVGQGGVLALENPDHDDLEGGLFELLLIIRGAQEDGSWSRLKACANTDCSWVFFDRSRNRQGSWCDMAVCGNRLKNRQFRVRRR
jgi:hypothetical protein